MTTQTTPEVESLVRDILRASGSSLDFFSMEKTRQAMFAAAKKHINAAYERGTNALSDNAVEALKKSGAWV